MGSNAKAKLQVVYVMFEVNNGKGGVNIERKGGWYVTLSTFPEKNGKHVILHCDLLIGPA